MQIFAFIFLCIVWGTTWIAIKVSLEGLPPFLGASLRFVVAVIFLGIYIGWQRVSLKVPKKSISLLTLSAFLMYVLDYGLIYWGEQYLSAGVTSIFFATFPLFTALWAKLFYHQEKFPLPKTAGLLIGFAGIFIVFFSQLVLTHFSTMVVLGTLAITVGAAGGSMSIIVVKKYLQKINHISLSFYQMLLGVFFLMLIGIIGEDAHVSHLNQRVFIAIIYLGAMGSALAFALYFWLLKTSSPVTLSLIIYITPIVAIIGDYFFYGQVLNLREVIGMAVVFAGIALSQMENLPFIALKRVPQSIQVEE
jgi:drug/metabolite transporter (DMT)-like permease